MIATRKPSRLDRLANSLDEAISLVAPAWGARRKSVRRADRIRARISDRMARKIENSHFERGEDPTRADKWLGSRLSINDALEWELDDLRDKSDELYRTFGPANGAIESRVDNVVGTGIRVGARISETPGVSVEQAEAWNAELDALWERQAACVGTAGESLRAVTKLLARCLWRDGEAFYLISDVKRDDAPVPLAVEIIDPRRVETPPEKTGDASVRLGIQFDKHNRPVGYYVRSSVPNDSHSFDLNYDYYPAERMGHVFEKQWPDQRRGIPWLSPVVSDIRDLKDYREATIISAQVAACVTMVVGTSDEDLLTTQNCPADEHLEPGQIIYRPLGEDVQTLNPSQPTTTFGAFVEACMLGLSAGLRWPFGWLTKDRRRASYSAGKLEEIEGGQVIRSDQVQLDETFLRHLWARFVDECVALGLVSISARQYEREKWKYRRHKSTPPGRPWIDPVREIPAMIKAKDHNLMTLEEIHTREGRNTDDVLRRRQWERWTEGELGIVPPENAGKTSATAEQAGRDESEDFQDDDPAEDTADDDAELEGAGV